MTPYPSNFVKQSLNHQIKKNTNNVYFNSYGQSPSLQPQVVAGTASEGEGDGPSIPNVRLAFITAADQTKFEQLYIQGCSGGKYLTGEGAKEILLKSKLDATTLSQIWFVI
ncbi:13629_t:CDS:2 [Funneliformis geosporum]|nr:13629_t:CDS:2 [Funneliformis geosporum]